MAELGDSSVGRGGDCGRGNGERRRWWRSVAGGRGWHRSQRCWGSPDLVEVAGYGGWRSIGTGRLDPQMGDGCRETKTFLLPYWYDLLLLFFSFLCADAGERSCFAQADGPVVVLDRSDDSSSLPFGRDTFRGTQSQRWRRLLQVCWIDVHALSAMVSRKEEAAWRQLYRGRR